MAKSKKNASRAAARNKAALQEKMLVGALNADRARVFRRVAIQRRVCVADAGSEVQRGDG